MTLTIPVRLDPTSPPDETLHVTACGLPVLIYNINGGGKYPIHGAVLVGDVWSPRSWMANGKYLPGEDEDPLDLRDRAPVKRGVWVAWFESEGGIRYAVARGTKEEAISPRYRLDLRGVTYLEEGDGLDTPAEPPLWVDWAKLPERAKAAAADENGAVWCFEHQPIAAPSGKWLGRVALHAPIDHRLYRLAPGFDWRETLTRRPEVQDD